MKKLYIFLLLTCAPLLMNAGCIVQFQVINVTCFGNCDGSATAFPSGQAPFIYSWSPGGQVTQTINNLCAGTYTCIVTDANGCNASGVVTISEPAAITISNSVTNASCSSCCDGFIVSNVTGGTPPYTYLWTPTNQTSPTAQSLCPGSYTLCVTDVNGCSSCVVSTVSFSTGIVDQPANGSLSIYPNPSSQFVMIDQTFANPTSSQISVCNVLGEIVFAKKSSSSTQLHEKINVADLPDGIYFVTVQTASGNSVQRFIKQ